jgi:hypothetical protein
MNLVDLKTNPEFSFWLGMQYPAGPEDAFNRLSAEQRADIERRYQIRFPACAWDSGDPVAGAITDLVAAQNALTAAIGESAYDVAGADEARHLAAHERCKAIVEVVRAVADTWDIGVTGTGELGRQGLADFAAELTAATGYLTEIAKGQQRETRPGRPRLPM